MPGSRTKRGRRAAHVCQPAPGSSKDEEFEVEKLLEKRVTYDGNTTYLVKWRNYHINEATWEPEEHCADCTELVDKFERDVEKALKDKKRINNRHQVINIDNDDEDTETDEGHPLSKQTHMTKKQNSPKPSTSKSKRNRY